MKPCDALIIGAYAGPYAPGAVDHLVEAGADDAPRAPGEPRHFRAGRNPGIRDVRLRSVALR